MCRRKDIEQQLLGQLAQLSELPRPLLGHRDSWQNQAIGEPHCHPWIQLSYAVEGILTVETARARLVAPPSRAVWIPPGVTHGVRAEEDTLIRSIYVSADVLPGRPCEVIRISPLLRELILEFGQFQVEYEVEGPNQRVIQVLVDRLAIAPSCDLRLPWPEDIRLHSICSYLAAHPDCRFPMAHFSADLGVSDKTLSRRFMTDTGMTFRQWRQRSRLLASLPLLEKGMRVTDVAIECGYDSLSAFISSFGELVGCTPRNYMQRLG